MEDERLFTIAQIAAGLGLKHKAQARRRIMGVAPTGRCKVRGKADADGWSISSLPCELQRELECIRRRHGYASIEALLESPPRVYQHPLVPRPSQLREAEWRREILAPLLANRGGKTLAQLARDASAILAAKRVENLPTQRTLENWITEAIERDGNWEQWERVELFLGNGASAPAAKKAPQFDVTLPDDSSGSGRNQKARAKAWQDALTHWDVLQAAGVDPVRARAEILDAIRFGRSPLARSSRESLLKQWPKKLRAWQLGGGLPCSLYDRPRSGRPKRFSLTKAETKALRGFRLQKGSLPLALSWFVRDPACLPETRALILAELDRAAQRRREPHWPGSLRRAAQVTAEEEALFRGPKHFQRFEHCDRRGLWWIDDSGAPQASAANVLWESDDMSLNEPFTWRCAETGETQIGRQTLCTQDVFSRFWLGHTLIGRSRDAYRVEDIADHIRECVALHGLPVAWRIERGVWENSFIDGVKIGTDAHGEDVLWGGLEPIIHIERTFKSRGKGGIESSFNFLQDLIAHEGLHIGRGRGEFERATKLHLAASSGREAAASQFWSSTQGAEGLSIAMQQFNLEPKKRRAFGRDLVVPADLFHGAPRREVPASELWRFCPIKATASVRRGHIEKAVKHYPIPFRFTVNGCGCDTYIPHGFKVLIAFHPGHPEMGCHVFNAETGANNREGWLFGELLLIAPIAEDAPQFSVAPQDRDFMRRKNANAAVRTEFRGIVPSGRVASRTSTSRDGWGNSAVVENHARPERKLSALDSRRTRAKEIAARAYDDEKEIRAAEEAAARAVARGDLTPTWESEERDRQREERSQR